MLKNRPKQYLQLLKSVRENLHQKQMRKSRTGDWALNGAPLFTYLCDSAHREVWCTAIRLTLKAAMTPHLSRNQSQLSGIQTKQEREEDPSATKATTKRHILLFVCCTRKRPYLNLAYAYLWYNTCKHAFHPHHLRIK